MIDFNMVADIMRRAPGMKRFIERLSIVDAAAVLCAGKAVWEAAAHDERDRVAMWLESQGEHGLAAGIRERMEHRPLPEPSSVTSDACRDGGI